MAEKSHTILASGGADFIGSSFVLDWLAVADEQVISLAGKFHKEVSAEQPKGALIQV